MVESQNVPTAKGGGPFGSSSLAPESEAEAAFEPRLADPGRSRAVLIDGDSPHVPGIEISELALALMDGAVWGLSASDCRIHSVTERAKMLAQLRQSARDATEAFVVCFKGPAVPHEGRDVDLRLDASDTSAESMLPLIDLLNTVASSSASLRLLILDCGLSADLRGLGGPVQVLVRHRSANTGLSAAVVSVLSGGVRGGPELLTVDEIAGAVRSVAAHRGDGPSRLALARNRAFGLPSAPPPPSHHVPWQHDTPASRDLLQREALARILGKRLRQVTTEAPGVSFLAHLDGQWGTGKSTLLNLLAEDLGEDFVVVGFNAWRHSRVEPTWYPLLTAVRDTVVDSRPWYHFRLLRLRETLMRIRYAGASWALPMAATSVAITAGVLALSANWDPVRSGAILSVAGPALAVAGLVWGASRVAARLFLWDSARGARIFEQSHKDPMGEVAHHFAWLLRHARRPVVIFIDDLDRCDRATVVETLEVVQNLIRESPGAEPGDAASFVVSADGAWLRCAFEGHFEDFKAAIDEPGRPLGYLFQDKLFQLSVPLRFLPGEQQSSYMASLLTLGRATAPGEDADAARRIASARSEAEVVEVLREVPADVRVRVAAQAAVKMADPDILRSTEHALLKFAPLLQPNPRGIKRFLNTYTVLRTLRTLEAVPVDLDTLAAWAMIRSRWPQLADELEARPELLDELAAGGGGDAATVELRALLAALPVPLTGREVRACCGNRPALDDAEPPVPPSGDIAPPPSR
ncbi:KAP family P-loop NTPase fold protein [Phytomonospora endophytica]|uniref:KAP NTPase domain-containing protein n=1 Tax=Phytomonospora endophytica TaxID=714109 RepID=A0A841FEK1_9ACTN|nr:P-loop NTPase fold protein [Phytomonospora endophytica]MBB6034696.1 hypothetical protein [Phytomonospora endophytica]